MKKLVKFFLEGLLFLIPVAATIYIVYSTFSFVDNLLPTLFGLEKIPPGVGLVVTLIFITFLGFLASNILTKSALGAIESLLNRLPLVKLVYSSIKDLIGAFVGDKKSFDKPAFVTLVPGSGIKVIGFITRESMERFGLEQDVAVYLPQSYNFAGNLIIVPKERVQLIEADSSEVMKFLVSGGVAG